MLSSTSKISNADEEGENGERRNVGDIPTEYGKTFVAFIFLTASWLCTMACLSVVHDRVPETRSLPDVVHTMVPKVNWGLKSSEVIILCCVSFCLILVLLHKHRSIILRRVFFLIGLLYLFRAITMLVTILPSPDENIQCAKKAAQHNFTLYLHRFIYILPSGGLSITGHAVLCGDYIYSGHTFILVLCYLVTKQYAPDRLLFLAFIIWFLSFSGIIMLLISRSHYTIDVVLAYYITTRLFWAYHRTASDPLVKTRSFSASASKRYSSSEWWIGILHYFELNVPVDELPNEYQWPCALPKFLKTSSESDNLIR